MRPTERSPGWILKAIVTGNAGGGIQPCLDDANDNCTFTNSTPSGCTVNNNGTSGRSHLGTATFCIKEPQNSSIFTIKNKGTYGSFARAVQVPYRGTNMSADQQFRHRQDVRGAKQHRFGEKGRAFSFS